MADATVIQKLVVYEAPWISEHLIIIQRFLRPKSTSHITQLNSDRKYIKPISLSWWYLSFWACLQKHIGLA